MKDQYSYLISSLICATVGIGVAVLGCQYQKQMIRWLRRLAVRHKLNWIQQIVVANNTDECTVVINNLKKKYEICSILGLDCEWVTKLGKRRPVALLQLASFDGYCALIRLSKVQHIPQDLKIILEDRNLLKIGVGTLDDAKYILKDYGVALDGCVDLRLILPHHVSGGLAGIAESLLGVSLDKSRSIRCSDWEANVLSERQINYAAQDALVAMDIAMEVVLASTPLWKLLGNVKPSHINEMIQNLCKPYVGVRVKKMGLSNMLDNAEVKFKISGRTKQSTRNYSRQTPIYHNCFLEAPDGDVLCTCDPKKANWYVSKGLGAIMSQDPLIVRLNFEPAARLQGESGVYYKLAKSNICVVCGETDSYVRKSIIPHEYRKHFPAIMKDHLSHDILLLCLKCHQLSNCRDMYLRQVLACECNAPIGSEEQVKVFDAPDLKKVHLAAKALLRNGSSIPDPRKSELESIITEYCYHAGYSTELMTDSIKLASAVQEQMKNGVYSSHGYRVVKYYENLPGGLSSLQKKWREHFVETMKPQHLPLLWSIEHKHPRFLHYCEEHEKEV